MNLKEYDYSLTKINALVRDSDYLWIGFRGGTLKKASAFNASQIFYTLTPSVDNIFDLNISGNYIFVLVDDSDYIGIKYSTNNPLGSYTNISIPSGITQTPKKSTHDGTNWFVLLPGESSGSDAKVVIFNDTTYDTTLTLTDITYARDITNDGTNVWVVTYTDPAKLVKIYQDGGSWAYTSYEIT